MYLQLDVLNQGEDFMIQKKLIDSNSEINIELTSVYFNDSRYPCLLKLIPDPPRRLYARGNINILNKPSIAIVGTRDPSNVGIEYARRITKFYVSQGFVIVSGLARGIDTIVAETALKYNGSVIGVLPSSLDDITPPRNRKLVDDIVNNGGGVVISENSPGTKTQKFHFIKRNRIISGISLALVVIEIGTGKGTIHQIEYAKKQGRPVIIADVPNKKNQELLEQGYPRFTFFPET